MSSPHPDRVVLVVSLGLLLVSGSDDAGGSSRHGRTSRVAERRGVDRGAFALDGVEDLELVDPAVDDVQPTSTS